MPDPRYGPLMADIRSSERKRRPKIELVPCSLERANAFVALRHRHHPPTVGGRVAVAVMDTEGRIRGVGIGGRPVARLLDDGWTFEVNRVATDGTYNACSMIYGGLIRAAKALGYRRAFTYTLAEGETGASLRASGWTLDDPAIRARSWNMPGRPRTDKTAILQRRRWLIDIAPIPDPSPAWPVPEPQQTLALFP